MREAEEGGQERTKTNQAGSVLQFDEECET